MYLRREPYLWTTWITGLMAGSNHCQWAAWIRANYGDVAKRPPDIDMTVWTARHAEIVRKRADELRAAGYAVFIENENKFNLKGHSATVGGVADIVAIDTNYDGKALVIDCKTGKPRGKDVFQILLYMMLLPLAIPRYKGLRFSGELEYGGGARVPVSSAELTDNVRRLMKEIIESMSGDPLPKVPSAAECQWCDISITDCPERIEIESETITTELF
jgi:CRISPR/Cas system-associated exonuclease Cas4 (RecB family)